MPDFIQSALQVEGLHWVLLGAFIAGIVRGFSGFGTAMIYLPIALSFLDKPTALISLLVMDIVGPLPQLPKLVRDSKLSELSKLLLGMVIVTPLTIIFVFEVISQDALRYTVSIAALTLVILLILGVRYRGVLKQWMLYGTGMIAGFLGGVSGVPGPPVIMIYMASTSPTKVIRANNSLFLLCFDSVMFIVFFLRGLLTISSLLLGVIVTIPYAIGVNIGSRIFNPEYDKIYRWAAYAIIAISAIRGLPIWTS